LRRLTDQELDELSELAIESAENFIFSKVSKKEILDLDINVELRYNDVLDLNILVDLDLDELSSVNEKIIVEEAIDASLENIGKFLY
jgi:hypothetical protein